MRRRAADHQRERERAEQRARESEQAQEAQDAADAVAREAEAVMQAITQGSAAPSVGSLYAFLGPRKVKVQRSGRRGRALECRLTQGSIKRGRRSFASVEDLLVSEQQDPGAWEHVEVMAFEEWTPLPALASMLS